LLFIIYINDIIKACPDKCNINIFADDILIYVNGDGSEELEYKMNRVFLMIQLDVNQLKMNAEKTKYMIVRSIRKKHRGEIILRCADGTLIERGNNEVLGYYY